MDELKSILEETIDGMPITDYLTETMRLLDEGKISVKESNERCKKAAEINKANAKILREYKKKYHI
jgi:hypothetical protein